MTAVTSFESPAFLSLLKLTHSILTLCCSHTGVSLANDLEFAGVAKKTLSRTAWPAVAAEHKDRLRFQATPSPTLHPPPLDHHPVFASYAREHCQTVRRDNLRSSLHPFQSPAGLRRAQEVSAEFVRLTQPTRTAHHQPSAASNLTVSGQDRDSSSGLEGVRRGGGASLKAPEG